MCSAAYGVLWRCILVSGLATSCGADAENPGLQDSHDDAESRSDAVSDDAATDRGSVIGDDSAVHSDAVEAPMFADDSRSLDAGIDASTDASTTDAMDGAASGPAFPRIPNHGGPVLSAPEVVPIFFAGDPLRSDLDRINAWILTSNYWTSLGAEYGVHAGTMHAAVEIATPAPTTTTSAAIQSWIAASVTDGTLPPPTANTLYAVFYPSTTTIAGNQDCASYYGFHGTVQASIGTATQTVPYAVIARCGDPVDQLTIASNTLSHEYFEAATDPFQATQPAWILQAPAGDPLEPWLMIGGGELSDICTNEPYARIEGFRVQHAWSNQAAAAGRNPCQPNDPATPYFIVFTDKTIYTGSPGSDLVIHGHAWSNQPTGAWNIGINTAWVPPSDFDGAAALQKTVAGAGDDVAITVHVPPVASDAGRRIYQFTVDSLDPTNPDFYHPWPVMIVVP